MSRVWLKGYKITKWICQNVSKTFKSLEEHHQHLQFYLLAVKYKNLTYYVGSSVILLQSDLCASFFISPPPQVVAVAPPQWAVTAVYEVNSKRKEKKITNYILFHLTGRANLNNACQTWWSAISCGKWHFGKLQIIWSNLQKSGVQTSSMLKNL